MQIFKIDFWPTERFQKKKKREGNEMRLLIDLFRFHIGYNWYGGCVIVALII